MSIAGVSTPDPRNNPLVGGATNDTPNTVNGIDEINPIGGGNNLFTYDPTLAPPQDFEVELSKILAKIASDMKDSAVNQMKNNQAEQQKQFEKKIKELLEWIEESKKADKWGAFGRAMSYIGSALSIVGGALLVATGVGAGVGAALIVGGVIGLTDQILKDTGAVEGGFAGLIAKGLMEIPGLSDEAAQWIGMALYIVIVIAASAGAGYAAGSSAMASVASRAGSMAGTVGKAAAHAGSKMPNAVSSGAQAIATKASKILTAMSNHKAVTNSAIGGTTIGAGLTGSAANTVAGVSQSESLKHMANAQDIAAMIEKIALSLQMRKEDLEEALQYFMNVISRISSMLQGSYEAELNISQMRTHA